MFIDIDRNDETIIKFAFIFSPKTYAEMLNDCVLDVQINLLLLLSEAQNLSTTAQERF